MNIKDYIFFLVFQDNNKSYTNNLSSDKFNYEKELHRVLKSIRKFYNNKIIIYTDSDIKDLEHKNLEIIKTEFKFIKKYNDNRGWINKIETLLKLKDLKYIYFDLDIILNKKIDDLVSDKNTFLSDNGEINTTFFILNNVIDLQIFLKKYINKLYIFDILNLTTSNAIDEKIIQLYCNNYDVKLLDFNKILNFETFNDINKYLYSEHIKI